MKSSAAFLFVFVGQIHSAVWYSATDGSATNGTQSNPWSVNYAVGTTVNPYLAAGDTVRFLSGTFVCNETNEMWEVAPVLAFHISGDTDSEITYMADSLWGFTFNGGLLITNGVSNLVLFGLRITCPELTNRWRTAINSMPPGIVTYGVNVSIMHNLMDSVGHAGISSWKGTEGKYIAGNIIRFVGYNDYTPKPPPFEGNWDGADRGSAMYLQNLDDSAEALIAGNITYYNYTTGMKAYGNTDIYDFRFFRNIIAENHEAAIFYHQDNYPTKGVFVHSNYIWSGNPGLRMGYTLGNGDPTNANIIGNYVVDTNKPIFFQDGWWDCTVSNNTFVNPFDNYIWYLEESGELQGDKTSHHIDNNLYYVADSGNSFYTNEHGINFSTWQSVINGDSGSTYMESLPDYETNFVFNPSTDVRFVHVACFNWITNSTATIDLSGFYASGALLSIYDAQNIPTVWSNVNYEGGDILLDLTLTNRAEMLGTFTNLTDEWTGFDDRFRAFVIYQYGTNDTASAVITGNAIFSGRITMP